MEALIYYGPNNVLLSEMNEPKVGPGETLLGKRFIVSLGTFKEFPNLTIHFYLLQVVAVQAIYFQPRYQMYPLHIA